MAKKKPGRWDDILEELPKSFGQDPDRQQKIDAIKAEIHRKANEEGVVFTPAYLTVKYGEIRREEDEIRRQENRIGLERDAYEQIISDTFDREQISRNVMKSGEAVTTYREPRPKVFDPEAYRLWCIKNGYEKQLTMHSSRTASLVKERLEAGEEEPDGIVAQGVLRVRYNKPGAAPSEAPSIADIFEAQD